MRRKAVASTPILKGDERGHRQSPSSRTFAIVSSSDTSHPTGGPSAVYTEWDVTTVSADDPLVEEHPRSFALHLTSSDAVIDPRVAYHRAGVARLRPARSGSPELLTRLLSRTLPALAEQTSAGIFLRRAVALGALLRPCVDMIRQAGVRLLVDGQDLNDDQLVAIAGNVDGVAIAAADRSCEDLIIERDRLRACGPVLLHGEPTDLPAEKIAVSDGIVAPEEQGSQLDHAAHWAEIMAGYAGEIRILSAAASPVLTLLRTNKRDFRHAESGLLIHVNRSTHAIALRDALRHAAPFDFPVSYEAGDCLEPHELRAHTVSRAAPVRADDLVPAVSVAAAVPRLRLETISPAVDGGVLPVKRVVGETVDVEASLFGDGHEQLAAELQWRPLDAEEWQTVRMDQLPNDAWHGALRLDRLGRYEFAVEGWLDRFGGYRRDFRKKREAGVAATVDFDEGIVLIENALDRAAPGVATGISSWLSRYSAAADEDQRSALLLAPDIAGLMDAADDRPHSVRSAPHLIDAERLEARYSSWYELFPRSITQEKSRHGTFLDVIERLPAIRAMGFDTLYFPPIHPIGKTNRKGPNNSLTPGPDDVGSPYAIGSADGGHDALHPELGSFADFERLVAAAADQGLEIAIDFAIQCSPDHPWLQEHPGWFAWRPDGSMKYAENPPKKYQDIVNVDFYGPDAIPDLWRALRDVVLLWVRHGVKTFRVDNPHTKPLPFWEWMIGEVRAHHPETIFLAEAFTRPTMMYRLAKIGFSQSYTYFTWRNGKKELTDYLTELTTTAPKEFYRPHFFVNTPDINPPYLQTSGRAGFRIRATLAATLSGLFGIYSGFELCESAPLPGKEEYLDSEKYEIRPRDWSAPGNIIADISLLNRLRKAHPALQTHLNTRFYTAQDDNILYYGKPSPDGSDLILVMVNLDPHAAHEAHFEVPLWEFGLPDSATIAVEDLAEGHRFDWHGKDQWIRIAPEEPYRLWRIWSEA
jgi:starch synthase (maltosyl-transferring)